MEASDSPTPVEVRRPFSRNDLIGELVVVLSLGLVMHLVNAACALLDDTLRESPVWLSYAMGIAASVQVAVPVAWIMYRSDKPLSAFGIRTIEYRRDIGLAVGVCLWTWLAFFLARTLLSLTWSIPVVWDAIDLIQPTRMSSWKSSPVGAGEISLLLGYDIANGFAEELVIRCYLITRLTQLLGGPWRAVISSSAIMASYHVYQGSFGAIEIFMAEIFIGALWLLMPRLWPFAIGHAMYNVSLVLFYSI